jgi:exopolysaccharide biosynthesis protein
MGKRGSISLFVILGVFILLVAWGAFVGRPEISGQVQDEAAFAGVLDRARSYVEVCLEQVTLDAVDAYGFIGSERKISDHIDSNMLDCLNRFELISSLGNEVQYDEPISSVILSDNALNVEVYFPITLNSGDKKVTFERFAYNLQRRTSVDVEAGILRAGTVLFSEDNDLVLRAEQDTVVVVSSGSTSQKISVKMNDREYNGLENSIVYGNIIYEGLGEGVKFSPPLKATLRIRRIDLPLEQSPASGRLSWFDKEAGIWRAYTGQGFGSDREYYYYTASVDHFTPIAVVDCDGKDEETWTYPMSFVYRQLIEPTDEGLWRSNDGTGKHLIAEVMGNASCQASETMKYDLGDIDPAKACSTDGLIKDWDNDDLPAKAAVDYSYQFIIGGLVDTDVEGAKLSDGSDPKASCYEACKKQVDIDLKCYYGGQCSPEQGAVTEGIGPFTDDQDKMFDPSKFGDEDISLVSGDGISDRATLICSYDGEKTSLQAETVACAVSSESTLLEPVEGALSEEYKWVESTLDISQNRFYATLMTYGYPTVGIQNDAVGGKGTFVFEVDSGGNSCIETVQGLDASILLGDGDPDDSISIGDEPAVIASNPLVCSPGDECTWTLNNKEMLEGLDHEEIELAGKIQAGKNYVTVKVENIVNEEDLGDVQAYGQGILSIRGSGISVEKSSKPEDPAGLNVPKGTDGTQAGGGGVNAGNQMGGGSGVQYGLEPGEFKEVFPGIELKKVDTDVNPETGIVLPRRVIYYVARIDLENKDLGYYVTPRAEIVQSTSQFMANYPDKNIILAINGGGFEYGNGNEFIGGFAASEGDIYSDPKHEPAYGGGPTIVISEKNTVTLGKENPDGLYHAATGFQTVLLGGEVVERFIPGKVPDCTNSTPKGETCHKPGYDVKDPRTSIGLVKKESGEGHKYMLWIVVDGRGESGGVDMQELARMHKFYGADIASNFDGGGSSAMVINDNGVPSVINKPSDPGGERRVANHIGVTRLSGGSS